MSLHPLRLNLPNGLFEPLDNGDARCRNCRTDSTQSDLLQLGDSLGCPSCGAYETATQLDDQGRPLAWAITQASVHVNDRRYRVLHKGPDWGTRRPEKLDVFWHTRQDAEAHVYERGWHLIRGRWPARHAELHQDTCQTCGRPLTPGYTTDTVPCPR